jgi:hypothetical protein
MVDWALIHGGHGEYGLDDEYEDAHAGPQQGPRMYSRVKCKECGQGSLRWRETAGGKFWLIDVNGDWHDCPARRKLPQDEPGFRRTPQG